MTSKEIRESFLRFFESKGHKVVPSAPMVLKGDPTLMFTNAGMNQFKDIILGNTDAKYTRIADAQKCLRVSGKHNDLEEVGHDTYHHTMFEMLGNWSFGDYFKKEAIDWAWEFLTDVLKLDKKQLYVTYFEGYAPDSLDADLEAASFWEKYLPSDHILKGSKHDNFWEMGEQGPCGPCSEIHIDIRPIEERERISGRELVNTGHPQVIEIWNLVFMQYNRKADGSLDTLPIKVIDTGMGFERICMAIQGKTSNYDTDVFVPLIQSVSTLTGINYGDNEMSDVAMRVVADHIRTIAFSIADGQLPGNAKAGYVIRRILRRAVRYGYTFLGQKNAFMYNLIPVLITSMGEAYPELAKSSELITKVVKEEEDSFMKTLETGIKLLDKMILELKSQNKNILSGQDAFVLYDTYGFPIDLTSLILSENGMTVNEKGFTIYMEQQKQRARNAAHIDTDDWIVLSDDETVFVGYDSLECDTSVVKYRKVQQKNNTFYHVVLSKTPFYSEMGGQVGDSGVLVDNNGDKYTVIDTKRENNLPIHIMTKLPDNMSGAFVAVVDSQRRNRAEANHTATHLLHEALREILGTHVEQKGSFVSPDMLRFDFSHFEKVSHEDLLKVERLVNDRIRHDFKREEYRNIPMSEALAMGAIALFGEKYGEDVRVLKYGKSIELCGGTHIENTAKIGLFKIISESSVAAGVRRIEAITGKNAEDYIYKELDIIREVKSILGNNAQPLVALNKLIEEKNNLEVQIDELNKIEIGRKKTEVLHKIKTLDNNIKIIVLENETNQILIKDLAFQLSGEITENLAIVSGISDNNSDKCQVLVMLSKNLTTGGDKCLNASMLVRSVGKMIEGGGGGQPHFATAGGKNKNGLSEAVKEIVRQIESFER